MSNQQSDTNKRYNEAKQKVGHALDGAFGEGTGNTVAGAANQALGYAEIEVGHNMGDRDVEFDGIKHAARGTVERAAGQAEHDAAALKAQVEKEAARLSELKAEYAAATGEARAQAQTRIDSTKSRLQALVTQISSAIEQAKTDAEAKIASLQQQAAQATGEAKVRIEGDIADVQYDNQQFADYLREALQKNQLVLSR